MSAPSIPVVLQCKHTMVFRVMKDGVCIKESTKPCTNNGNQGSGLCKPHRKNTDPEYTFACVNSDCEGTATVEHEKCDRCKWLEIAQENARIRELNIAKGKVLQEKFLELVAEMESIDCALPPDFKLFYTVTHHWDRRGQVIHIKPALTYSNAVMNKKPSRKWIGSHGSNVDSFIINSNTYVSTENYSTDNITKHEADFKIEI